MEQLYHVFEYMYHAITRLLIKHNCTFTGYRTSSDASTETLVDENAPVSGNNVTIILVCILTGIILLGEIKLRTLISRTKKVEYKWFELGAELNIPISKLERIHDKHCDSPIKALIRVYRYWLADENGLMPTWKKLVNALQAIDEYSLAAGVSNMIVSCLINCYLYHGEWADQRLLPILHIICYLVNNCL